MRNMISFSLLRTLLVMAFVLCASIVVQATITMTDTGQQFASRPDNRLPNHFRQGFEYMARLQLLEQNHELCPESSNHSSSSSNWTVTVPSDGLPVALLARQGGCSYETKARFASNQIHPPHVVRYLIIYESHDPDDAPESDDDTAINYNMDEDDHHVLSQLGLRYSLRRHTMQIQPEEDTSNPHSKHSSVDRGRRSLMGKRLASKKHTDNDDDIDVDVLLVSHKTGIALWRTMERETSQTRSDGGTRLLLDGRMSYKHLTRSVMFWFGLSFLLAACMCSFVLSVRAQQEFFGDDEEQHARVRTVRRRLTIDEVRMLLPETEYDTATTPTAVAAASATTGGEMTLSSAAATEDASSPDRPQQDATSSDALDDSNDMTSPLLLGPLMQTHDCSICLDDYVRGDKIRALPCGHVFHSECITKWLTERSSVCPLCKTILEVQEDDSESDDDESTSRDYIELREGGTQTDDGEETSGGIGQMFRSLRGSTSDDGDSSGRRWWRPWQTNVTTSASQDDDSPIMEEETATAPSSQQPLLQSHENDDVEE